MSIQIPGWCLSPCLCWLRWSFLLIIVDRICKRVGVFTSNSLMQDLQWNSGSFSTGIFLKREGGLPARCHNLPHSASIRSNSLSKMCSRMPSWARTSLAIVGRWPPARACPCLHRLCSTTLEYGSDHDGVDTVICWSMRHRLMKLHIILWTFTCTDFSWLCCRGLWTWIVKNLFMCLHIACVCVCTILRSHHWRVGSHQVPSEGAVDLWPWEGVDRRQPDGLPHL